MNCGKNLTAAAVTMKICNATQNVDSSVTKLRKQRNMFCTCLSTKYHDTFGIAINRGTVSIAQH